jgi:hypothetical protein
MTRTEPSATDLRTFTCLICGGRRAHVELDRCKDYYLEKPVVVTYARCESCGLLQQHPLPTDVAAFYDDYPIHRPKSAMYTRLREAVLG